MAVIHVDGKQLEVNGAHNLLHACLSLGLDIPYFCWHPAMGSVGACRQCAVKQYNTAEDAQAGKGRLVMSCMTPVADNKTFISIDDDEAKAFRASVVEWLMTNHPHDCPVCEEGGHCHLQDMTVMTGHSRRRYQFTKRTHVNQDLGNFISHEMNRCIACYRCVRYYQDYAGGKDLGVFGAANNVYFGRQQPGTLESEFAGNLVEICPTGVFTDKTHSEHYNRKWDMQYAPSICQQCSVGCNTSPGERYGSLRRIENRYHGDVNGYFLCDRGRFGTGYVNNPDRPTTVQQKIDGKLTPVELNKGVDYAVAALKGKKILGIGSPRASIEANFALQKLVGSNMYSNGINKAMNTVVQKALEILRSEGITTPSLAQMEDFDAVIVLGEDITQTAPRVALAVRQAANNKAGKMAAALNTPAWLAEPVKRIAQNEKSPVIIIGSHISKLADIASAEVVANSNDTARLAYAIAAAIRGEQVAVDADATEFVAMVAAELKAAERVLIVSGTSLQDVSLLEAAATLAQALPHSGLTLVVPEVNSLGVAMLSHNCIEDVAVLDYDAVVVLENDIYERLPKALARQIMSKATCSVVLDHQLTDTFKQAVVGLPAASFAEGDGTVMSMEGRLQRFFQVYVPQYYHPDNQIQEGWRWLHVLASELNGVAPTWQVLDDVIDAVAAHHSNLAAITRVAPNAGYRVNGLKVAREPRRYSGRTAMRAPITVHEPRQPQDKDSGLTYSMEGYVGPQTNASMLPFAWAPGWNSPQAWNKFQDEVGGSLKTGDSGVRLFDLLPKSPAATYVMPALAALPAGQFTLLPMYSIFASDAMSQRSPVMQERKGDTWLTMSQIDADKLHVKCGDTLQVNAGSEHILLAVNVEEYFPEGCLGYPVGKAPAIDFKGSISLTVSKAAQVAQGA